jgi:hopanoid biosynthesis associated protein HpnK
MISTPALKLIVHADDFGLTEKINEGILQAHRHGILTSTSIVANGEAFEHAVALARANPRLDVGVHLTLVEERPLASPGEIPTLVDSDGRFHPHAIQFGRRYFAGKINLTEVRKELEAQVEKVLAAGLTPSHLDSHQHLHVLPGVLKVAVALGRKYGIPAMRIPREIAVFSRIGSVPFNRIVQALVLSSFCRMANGMRAQTTDRFAGFLFGGNLNKENLRKILADMPGEGSCEIMCHPGLEGPGTRYAHWHYNWLDELNALVDDEIKQYVHNRNIRLISYRELNG